MALRLFENPLSPYARKVKIALHEKGIPFQRIILDPSRIGDDPVHQDFVMTSPRLEVPALVDGDVRIFDSTIMLEYLDERWPKPPLAPASAAERARVRMLEEMMDTEYEAVNWGIAEIKIFQRADGERGKALLTRATLQLQRLWNRLERELDGRPWMNGERFGRGDVAVFPHVSGSENVGHPVDDRHPRLRRWLEACIERESVRKEAVEVTDALVNLSAGLAKRGMPRRRQFRDHRLEWMLKTGGLDLVVEGLEQGTIYFSREFE